MQPIYGRSYGQVFIWKDKMENFVPSGYFARGCVAHNEAGLVGCHACGAYLEMITSTHLKKCTNGTIASLSEHKQNHGINKKTALVSLARLEKMRNSPQTKRFRKNPGNAEALAAFRLRGGVSNRHVKNMEKENAQSECPAQLLATMESIFKMLGRTPSCEEFDYYHKAVNPEAHVQAWKKHWSMYNDFVLDAKLLPNKQGFKTDWSIPLAEEIGRDFYKQHKRAPTTRDCGGGTLPDSGTIQKLFGSFENYIDVCGLKLVATNKQLGQFSKSRGNSCTES